MAEGIFCKVKDLPEWAQEAVKKRLGPRHRPLCKIVPTTLLELGTPWHDSACRVLVAYREGVETKEIHATSNDTFWNSSQEERAAYLGEPFRIPEECAVLEILSYPEKATLYVHPSSMARILPELPKLSDLEMKALCITSCFEPAGRKEPFGVYGIGEKVFVALRRKKFITKSGAITLAGRNAIRHIDIAERQNISSPPFELREKYYKKMRRAEGW